MIHVSLLYGLLAAYAFALVFGVDGLGSQPRITEAPNFARRQGAGSNLIGYLTTDGACTLFTTFMLLKKLLTSPKGILSIANRALQCLNQVRTLPASQLMHRLSL